MTDGTDPAPSEDESDDERGTLDRVLDVGLELLSLT